MYIYGRENLAMVHVMIQSPYVTKIRRDVAMTFTTFIANSGGLLGLCIGFSFMSGIEIIFYFCYFCRFFKQKICRKTRNEVGSLQVQNSMAIKDSISSNENQNSDVEIRSNGNSDIDTAANDTVLINLVNTVKELEEAVKSINVEVNALREERDKYSMGSSYAIFGSWKKPRISKTMYHEDGKNPKNPRKIHIKCSKFSRDMD